MKRLFSLLLLATAAVVINGAMASAQMKMDNPMVGGAAMYRTKTIVDNAINSPIHTTLVKAVMAAGLVDTLKSKGPFTVFAPTDDAFAKVPSDALNSLMQPENKGLLTSVLTYHVVAGKYDGKKIAQLIKQGGGSAKLPTVDKGHYLTATMAGSDLILTDEKGGRARVTTANVYQSNGVIHVVDTVLMPGEGMMMSGDMKHNKKHKM
ncbi:MAG TPA: fasciclin domain-containing protein [Pyrinomonadaceae bacterium]|nr:fasciclin domain-containing protein [Pyrinomonadaceae bacterium]